jgi:hypothetical protein
MRQGTGPVQAPKLVKTQRWFMLGSCIAGWPVRPARPLEGSPWNLSCVRTEAALSDASRDSACPLSR